MILRRIFSRTFGSSKHRDESKESKDTKTSKNSKAAAASNWKANGAQPAGKVEQIGNKVANSSPTKANEAKSIPSIRIVAPDEEILHGAETADTLHAQAPGSDAALPRSTSPAIHSPTSNSTSDIPVDPTSGPSTASETSSSIASFKAPPLPIEVIEIIIDNVADGVTFISCSLVCKEWLARCRFYLFGRIKTAAGNCSEPSRILSSPSKAGHFVRSLVITQSAPDLLGDVGSKSYGAAEQLVKAVPNVRELQMFGITDWSLERFLDPLAEQLEDLMLSDIRTLHWGLLRQRLAKCTRLKCLTINTPHFDYLEKKEVKPEVGKINPVGGDTDESQLFLPNLEKLVLEGEQLGSKFIEELIGGIYNALAPSSDPSSPTLAKLHTVELPLSPCATASSFIQRLGPSLKELSLHCCPPSWDPSNTLSKSPFFEPSSIPSEVAE